MTASDAASRPPYLAAFAVAGGAALLFWRIAATLVHDWRTDPNYSHGLLVVPAIAWILWRERPALRRLPIAPSASGLLLIAAGVGLVFIGTLGAERFLTALSLPVIAAGAVLFLGGPAWLRAVRFPLLLFVLAIPLPAIIFNQIAFPLQLWASRFGVGLLKAIGLPVLREGNVIMLPQMTLEVAEACSGIRSLITLITVALLYGYVNDASRLRQLAVVLMTVPIAVTANAFRVALSGIAAHYWGPAAVEGLLHTVSGWLIFIGSAALVMAADAAYQRVARPRTRLAVETEVAV